MDARSTSQATASSHPILDPHELGDPDSALDCVLMSDARELGGLTEARREAKEIAAQTLEVDRVSVWFHSRDRTVTRCSHLFDSGRLAEHSLRQSEERYRLLIENSSDLLCELSWDGRFLYASPTCEQIIACAQGKVVSQIQEGILLALVRQAFASATVKTGATPYTKQS